MDEVLLIFDCPSNQAVDTQGLKVVTQMITSQEKTYFIVMLACCTNSTNLKLFLI